MKCQARIWDNWSEIQCTRTATVDGRWCRQHSPEAKAARQAKTTAAWEAKHSARVRDIHRLALHDDLVAALETLLADVIAAKQSEAGRMGFALTLPELESRFPDAFTNIAWARDVLRRAKDGGE